MLSETVRAYGCGVSARASAFETTSAMAEIPGAEQSVEEWSVMFNTKMCCTKSERNWPNQPWFPELVELLTAAPWSIPLRRDLLSRCGTPVRSYGTCMFGMSAQRTDVKRISVSLGYNCRSESSIYQTSI